MIMRVWETSKGNLERKNEGTFEGLYELGLWI